MRGRSGDLGHDRNQESMGRPMKGMCLVTGAGGFIGSHLVEFLLRQGLRVRALVRYTSTGTAGWLDTLPHQLREGLTIVQGDVRDAESVDQVVAGCDVVFHLAALIGIPYSYTAPGAYVDINIKGTYHVLEAARRHGVGRVVVTSTSEVYGTARYTPIDEDHPLQPQSPYSATKIGADNLALSYFHSFGLPITVVRPFNTFGPRQSARAVIPTIISQLLVSEQLRLGNLTPVRDLLYVEDTARGFVAAAESPATIGTVLNLATGEGSSVGSLVERIGALTGRSPHLVQDSERVRPDTSEVFRLIGSNKRAGELAGWTPRISLDAGLERTVEWLRSHQHLYRPGEYSR
jgi:NAD dependent epimerase/dehydratase